MPSRILQEQCLLPLWSSMANIAFNLSAPSYYSVRLLKCLIPFEPNGKAARTLNNFIYIAVYYHLSASLIAIWLHIIFPVSLEVSLHVNAHIFFIINSKNCYQKCKVNQIRKEWRTMIDCLIYCPSKTYLALNNS